MHKISVLMVVLLVGCKHPSSGAREVSVGGARISLPAAFIESTETKTRVYEAMRKEMADAKIELAAFEDAPGGRNTSFTFIENSRPPGDVRTALQTTLDQVVEVMEGAPSTTVIKKERVESGDRMELLLVARHEASEVTVRTVVAVTAQTLRNWSVNCGGSFASSAGCEPIVRSLNVSADALVPLEK